MDVAAAMASLRMAGAMGVTQMTEPAERRRWFAEQQRAAGVPTDG